MLDQIQSSQRPEVSRSVSSAQVHELKNRLTVIKGLTQLLDRQIRRPELERDRLQERVSRLQNEVVRIEMLINEIGRRDDGSSAHSQPGLHVRSYVGD